MYSLTLQSLPVFVTLIDTLKEALENYPDDTRGIFEDFIALCEKPVMEIKSNEKLTAEGTKNIEQFYYALASLFPSCCTQDKVKIVEIFRFIVNAGKDPREVIIHDESTTFAKENNNASRAVIVNLDYIMERLRCSGAFKLLISEFSNAVAALDYSVDVSEGSSVINNNPNLAISNQMTKDEELAFYGLPVQNMPQNMDGKGSPKSFPSSDPSSPPKSPYDRTLILPHKELKSVLRDLTQWFLDFFLEVSIYEECSIAFCKLGLPDAVVALIDKDFSFDVRDKRLSYTFELLWNILEAFTNKLSNPTDTHDYAEMYTLMKHDCILDLQSSIRVLHKVLNFLITDGFRQSDKELRNEVLIILAMLTNFPNAVGHFLRNELITLLITYACVEDVGQSSWSFFPKRIANSRNFATPSDIDLEFKKQLWMLITELMKTNDPDALLCFAASPMMPSLLMYLEYETADESVGGRKMTNMSWVDNASFSPSASLNFGDAALSKSYLDDRKDDSKLLKKNNIFMNKNSTVQMTMNGSILSGRSMGAIEKSFLALLTPSKLKEFQVQACLCLLQNAPKVMAEFERLEGPARVLAIAAKYATADHPDLKALVFYSLVLLNRCLMNSESVRAYMEDSHSLQTFLQLFEHCSEEESRAQAVRIIGSLCSNHNEKCQVQLLEGEGLRLLLDPLRKYVMKRPALIGLKAAIKIDKNTEKGDPMPDPLDVSIAGEVSILIVAVLDCLNNAVVSNSVNEMALADLEGLDVLLDILEISPFVLRLQVLRLLSDLLMNAKLSSFVNCWRSSKTLRSAAQVLCHAWMDEEARLNSERKADGVICDLLNPLGNHEWPRSEAEIPLVGFNNDGFNNTYSQSLTVTKLATAILAGRSAVQTNLPVDICIEAMRNDSRSILSVILESLGLFDLYHVYDEQSPFKMKSFSSNDGSGLERIKEEGREESSPQSRRQDATVMFSPSQSRRTPGTISSPNKMKLSASLSIKLSTVESTFDDIRLPPREKQVLAVARKYLALREGEWWREVKAFIETKGVLPIEADANLLSSRLDHAFDAAMATQSEQMELRDEKEDIKRQEENAFLQQILTKKHQQIKAEWLKKNVKAGAVKKSIKIR